MSHRGSHLSEIHKLLSEDEIIEPSSPYYPHQSRVWAYQRQQNPSIVVQPRSVASLQAIVKYLCESSLDFGIRSGGLGSSSAKDVVVSMSAFDNVVFSPEDETVLIGAGQTWGDVDRKLADVAPGYAVCSARTPFVGVGGSIVSVGISWISHEFGLASDPKNLLDAHVVLSDGRVVWASEEPDLLWALRGGGGNFGVVIEFKLKCHPYAQPIYAGFIMYPSNAVDEISKRVAEFVKRPDPKIALHVFIGDMEGNALKGEAPKPTICLFVFDAHGEEHGRGDAGFKWALNITGATDTTSVMSYREVNQLQGFLEPLVGTMHNYLGAATVSTIDEEFVSRAWKWLENIISIDSRLGGGSFAIVEIMQPRAFASVASKGDTAWPRTPSRHILQLLVGFGAKSGCSDELALDVLEKAPREIDPDHTAADYLPSFVESYNDLSKIFGEHYQRLRELKSKYDRKGKFNKGLLIPPAN